MNGFIIENRERIGRSNNGLSLEINGVRLKETVSDLSFPTNFSFSLPSRKSFDNTDANGFFVSHNQKLQEALVKAVKQGNIEVVDVLLDHYLQLLSEENTADFSSSTGELAKTANFLPLIVAAQHGNYQMINLFLARGFKLEREHSVTCKCDDCIFDIFVTSQRRIEVYRAIANPMWISVTSKNPFLTAFELSDSLKSLARKEDEYVKEYEHLSVQCSQFAMGLLDECRTSKEQRVVLSYPGDEADESEFNEDSLGLVNSAISFGQKEVGFYQKCLIVKQNTRSV